MLARSPCTWIAIIEKQRQSIHYTQLKGTEVMCWWRSRQKELNKKNIELNRIKIEANESKTNVREKRGSSNKTRTIVGNITFSLRQFTFFPLLFAMPWRYGDVVSFCCVFFFSLYIRRGIIVCDERRRAQLCHSSSTIDDMYCHTTTQTKASSSHNKAKSV